MYGFHQTTRIFSTHSILLHSIHFKHNIRTQFAPTRHTTPAAMPKFFIHCNHCNQYNAT